MSKHIGIVACSAEGAALCYRTICLEGAEVLGRHGHPEVTMHTYPLAEYMRYIEPGDWAGVARLMLASARKVAAAGAELIVCPDNTIHQAFELVVVESPLPWLHIAEEVAIAAERQGFRTLGVLGTRFLMEGPVYPSRLRTRGIAHLTPEATERARINDIIFDELVNGIIAPASQAFFAEVIARLRDRGCDAVVLGCTEIPLIVTPGTSPLTTLDSTRLLARAALREAAG
jgi:aspartate racemase